MKYDFTTIINREGKDALAAQMGLGSSNVRKQQYLK